MKVMLPGFPVEIGETIQLPGIEHLLKAPIFAKASPETVVRCGSQWQRRLLELTPIRGDMKHVTIRSAVYLQTTGWRAIGTDEWHVDAMGTRGHVEPDQRVHLLQGCCEYSRTQFNASPVHLDLESELSSDVVAFNRHLNSPKMMSVLVGIQMPKDRIVTFTNHIHRAVDPPSSELRYMWRVRESDTDGPMPESESVKTSTEMLDIRSGQWVAVLRQSFGRTTA